VFTENSGVFIADNLLPIGWFSGVISC